MFAMLLLTALAAGPDAPTALETALGIRLPAWGVTQAELKQRYPQIRVHEPHSCASESPSPTTLDLRAPDLRIAGSPVAFIDFLQGEDGLDAIIIELSYRSWSRTRQQLMRAIEKQLGAPTEWRGRSGWRPMPLPLWRRPEALVVVYGSLLYVAEPGSKNAVRLEAFLTQITESGR